ncbi:hypothetical protein V2I01_36940 [Micromonospora sp. BRA006-A]|nr:hypothetical protein [Micromonospora sp. BRA006-A]
MPNRAATTPPSSAPTQFRPAATNNVVLPTRPINAGGVSRCRSEFATMFHNALCARTRTARTRPRPRCGRGERQVQSASIEARSAPSRWA